MFIYDDRNQNSGFLLGVRTYWKGAMKCYISRLGLYYYWGYILIGLNISIRLHECIDLSKLIKLYTCDLVLSIKINFTSIKNTT